MFTKVVCRAVALLLLLLSLPANSDWGEQLGLKSGHLLVATPQHKDGSFARSVVLLVGYGSSGARGLIVNRRGDSDLAADFGDVVTAAVASQPLFFGGPVGPEHRLMLANFRNPDDGAFEVVPGVFFVHGRRLLNSLTQVPESGAVYRVFTGFAGWGPLQLEHEVARGDWFVVPASRHYVLDVEPEQLWSELIRYYEAQMASLERSSTSGDG
ncbi:YqgE/AlgH family protein [Motiliproteus sediminis]|uniref:YqgE/AlgH family protein n=1 Tax=Motiliproteus sediminis TaxID=1468178 RepID=UPI001AEF4658|nr:YqgE/AlgH family protein [Motiliproteus sediminis]